jgi:hypothetical protein
MGNLLENNWMLKRNTVRMEAGGTGLQPFLIFSLLSR